MNAAEIPEVPPGVWAEPGTEELVHDTIPAPPPEEEQTLDPRDARRLRASEMGNRLGLHTFKAEELFVLADRLGDLIDAAEREGRDDPLLTFLRMSEARVYSQIALRGDAA